MWANRDPARSVAVGLKHDFCEHHRISVDVIWYDWAHAFDQLGIEFSGSSNPFITTSIRDQFPMHWMNSVSTRLGYEWMPTNRDTLRGGYVYHGSPVPDSTLNPYLDGVLNHAVSLGYSRSYQRCILNAAYQYNFGKHRHVGDSSLVGNDFDNSSGLGVGKDKEYIENYQGRLIGTLTDGKGTIGRYVRLYSKGNTSDGANHYVEVEVWGRTAPAG